MPVSPQHHFARQTSLLPPSALPTAARTRTTNHQTTRKRAERGGDDNKKKIPPAAPSSSYSSIGRHIREKNIGASIKKSPSHGLPAAANLQHIAAPILSFSLHRPLGAHRGTVRLTLHSSAASSSMAAATSGCWAPSHPWRHIQTELQREEEEQNRCTVGGGDRCLEFAGCRTAWEGLGSDAWDRDVVQILRPPRLDGETPRQQHNRRSSPVIKSVRFLSGIRDDQQASLLRALQPECVEFYGPREYGSLDALTASTTDLSVFHGAELGVTECRTLARWLPTAHRVRLNKTPASNVPAFVALFEALEASTALQVLEWDAALQGPDGTETSHPQWDRAVWYLEGAVRFNALRGLDHRGGDSGNRRPRNRSANAAADVLREWWRSTHRPPITPHPSQLSADGNPRRHGSSDDRKDTVRSANAGARGRTASIC